MASLSQIDKDRMKELLRLECNYSFDDNVMDSFLDNGSILSLQRGQTLIHVGETNHDIYFILEGITRHWYWNGDREKTAFFSQEGTMLISYHSYYFDKESFYSIEACCHTRIICIKREVFDKFVADSHDFAQWCLSMAQCQIFFFEMKNRVIAGSAKERYISFLKNRPKILNQVPLKIIATYLDVTPQYLSNLRKKNL